MLVTLTSARTAFVKAGPKLLLIAPIVAPFENTLVVPRFTPGYHPGELTSRGNRVFGRAVCVLRTQFLDGKAEALPYLIKEWSWAASVPPFANGRQRWVGALG